MSRALVVLVGGFVVLQGSTGIDVPKIAYFLLAGVAALGSVEAVWRARAERIVVEGRPWLACSVLLLLMMAISLPTAILHGTPQSNWIRDAATYGLLAAAPWLGLDMARSATPRQVALVAMAAALLATASFVIEWVPRRGLGTLPVSRLMLPSHPLGSFGYAVAVALGIRARGIGRLAWFLIATGVLVAFLLTGTRTTAVVLAAPVAIAVVEAWRHGIARSRDAALIALAHAVVVLAFFTSAFGAMHQQSLGGGPTATPLGGGLTATPLGGGLTVMPLGGGPTATPLGASIPPAASSQPGGGGGPNASQNQVATASVSPTSEHDLGQRFDTIGEVLSGRDSSLRERIVQTKVAWEAFRSSPLLGVGLGYSFTWTTPSGPTLSSFTLDTPVIFLAKFGLPAVLLCLLIGGAFLSTARATLRRHGWGWRLFTLLAVGAVFVALLPLGWPPEDKGTSFSLILLLGLLFARGSTPPGIESEGGAA